MFGLIDDKTKISRIDDAVIVLWCDGGGGSLGSAHTGTILFIVYTNSRGYSVIIRNSSYSQVLSLCRSVSHKYFGHFYDDFTLAIT